MLMLSHILAIAIFMAMFIAIIASPVHRFIPAIIGAAITIVVVFLVTMQSPEAMVSVFNLGQLGQWHFWVPGEQHIESPGINWQTIIFIGGMMVMVEGHGTGQLLPPAVPGPGQDGQLSGHSHSGDLHAAVRLSGHCHPPLRWYQTPFLRKYRPGGSAKY